MKISLLLGVSLLLLVLSLPSFAFPPGVINDLEPIDPQPTANGRKCTTQQNKVGNQCPNAGGCSQTIWTGYRCKPGLPSDSCGESLSSPITVVKRVATCGGTSTCTLTGEVTTEVISVPVCTP